MDRRTFRLTSQRRALLALTAAGALVLAACAPVVTVPTVTVTPSSASATMTGQVVDIPSDTQGTLEVVLADGSSFKVPPGHFPPPGMCRA